MVADPSFAELVQHLPEDACEDVMLFASRHVPPGVNTLELPVERDRSKRKEVRVCVCIHVFVCTCVYPYIRMHCVFMCTCACVCTSNPKLLILSKN